MKLLFTCIIASVTLAAGLAMGQTEGEIRAFVQRAEAQIIELLQGGYHAALPRATAVGLTEAIGQQLSATEFVIKDESEFKRYKEEETKPFIYAYAEAEKFTLNRGALEQLMKPGQDATALQSGATTMIRELARASGELFICRQMQDITVYWGDEAARAAGRLQHLYDDERRVNPVAIYGMYAEHLVRKQIPGGHTPHGLHAFVRSLAAEDSAYAKFAADVTENYPENDEALLRMLGAEASWSAMWAKGKECITLAEAKEETKAKRLTARLNKLIKKVADSKLPEKQKQYLYNKYSFRQLNALAGGKIKFDTPEEATEKLKSEKDAAREAMRQSSMRRLCRMYATFFRLLGEEDVWAMEGTPDERLEQLVHDAHLELTRCFVGQYEELVKILDSIQDTAGADAAIPALVHQLLQMDQTARLLAAIGYDAMFEKLLRENDITPKLFTTSDWGDILQLYAAASKTDELLTKRLWDNQFYHSEQLQALMSGRVAPGGASVATTNAELWSDSQHVLGSLSMMCVILTHGASPF